MGKSESGMKRGLHICDDSPLKQPIIQSSRGRRTTALSDLASAKPVPIQKMTRYEESFLGASAFSFVCTQGGNS